MRTFDAEAVNAGLDPSRLVAALREAFQTPAELPLRHHHTIPGSAEGTEATLLLMPAWSAGSSPRYIGVKSVTVHPDNPAKGLPSVQGVYFLLDGQTGTPLALIDGPSWTARRTAAASALASSYLSRPNSSYLLMIGTGRLVPELIAAHTATRPITRVSIWGRNPARATAMAVALSALSLDVTACDYLEARLRKADVVSFATTAKTLVFDGAWLQPGTHVDLVGGFRPNMREADDTAIRRSTVFVDTHDGATREAGDIVRAFESGALSPDQIAADLFALCRNEHSGHESETEITLFKSVGTALEDLATAALLMAESAP